MHVYSFEFDINSTSLHLERVIKIQFALSSQPKEMRTGPDMKRFEQIEEFKNFGTRPTFIFYIFVFCYLWDLAFVVFPFPYLIFIIVFLVLDMYY